MSKLPEGFESWSLREMYTLIEEKLPVGIGRVVAPTVLTLAVLGLIVWLLVFLYDKALEPLLPWIYRAVRVPELDPAISAVLSAVILIAIGSATFLGAAWVIVRMIRRNEKALYGHLDATLKPRLQGIYAKFTAQDTRMGSLERIARNPTADGSQSTADDSLDVHFARYGFGDRWTEVTELVRGLVKDNRIEVLVTNELLGCAGERDPYKGQRKDLEITYSVGGTMRPPFSTAERKPLVLPEGPVKVKGAQDGIVWRR